MESMTDTRASGHGPFDAAAAATIIVGVTGLALNRRRATAGAGTTRAPCRIAGLLLVSCDNGGSDAPSSTDRPNWSIAAPIAMPVSPPAKPINAARHSRSRSSGMPDGTYSASARP